MALPTMTRHHRFLHSTRRALYEIKRRSYLINEQKLFKFEKELQNIIVVRRWCGRP